MYYIYVLYLMLFSLFDFLLYAVNFYVLFDQL